MKKQIKRSPVSKDPRPDHDLFFLYNEAISEQRFRIYKNKLKKISNPSIKNNETALGSNLTTPMHASVKEPAFFAAASSAPIEIVIEDGYAGRPSTCKKPKRSEDSYSKTASQWRPEQSTNIESKQLLSKTAGKPFRINRHQERSNPHQNPYKQQPGQESTSRRHEHNLLKMYLAKPQLSAQMYLNLWMSEGQTPRPNPIPHTPTSKQKPSSNSKPSKHKFDLIIPFMEMKSVQQQRDNKSAAAKNSELPDTPGTNSRNTTIRPKLYSAVVQRRRSKIDIRDSIVQQDHARDQTTPQKPQYKLDSQPDKECTELGHEKFQQLNYNSTESVQFRLNRNKVDSTNPTTATTFRKQSIVAKKTKKIDAASPNKSRQFNIQIILRRKLHHQSSLSTYLKHFRQRMEYPPDAKLFIFKSHDDYIKRLLIRQGWVENLMRDSLAFHLKWVSGDALDDYSGLKHGQLYNHFKNNLALTTKIGLHKNFFRKARSHGLDQVLRFYPRTYDPVSEASQFAQDFQRTALLTLLKKHILYFQTREVRPTCENFSSQQIQTTLLQTVKAQNFINQYHRQDLEVNIPIVVQLVLYLQNWRRAFSQLPSAYTLERRTIQSLISFCKVNPPYQLLSSHRKSDITLGNVSKIPPNSPLYQSNQLTRSRKAIVFKSDFNRYSASECFFTPSQELVDLLYFYHQFFSRKSPTYFIDGTQNLWILKSLASSKGVGISLEDRFSNISDSKKEARLIQKYIEQPLLFRDLPPENAFLNNRKFDIRQWVLVKSVRPLQAYTYSEFYIRICPEEFDLLDFKNLARHLTNYSHNKHLFKNETQSAIHSSVFCQLLKTYYQIDFEKVVAPRIRSIIADTLRCYDEVLEPSFSSFELYGYDFLLTQDLAPYLLQVNLSPACSERTDWLVTMLQQMGDGLLRIVLPEDLYKPMESPNKWLPLEL